MLIFLAKHFSNDRTVTNQLQIFGFVCENFPQNFSACFNKSTKSRFCLVQKFFYGPNDSKKDVRMIPHMESLPPVETKPILSLVRLIHSNRLASWESCISL